MENLANFIFVMENLINVIFVVENLANLIFLVENLGNFIFVVENRPRKTESCKQANILFFNQRMENGKKSTLDFFGNINLRRIQHIVNISLWLCEDILLQREGGEGEGVVFLNLFFLFLQPSKGSFKEVWPDGMIL